MVRDGSRAIGGLDGGYGASDGSLPAGHSNGGGWQQGHWRIGWRLWCIRYEPAGRAFERWGMAAGPLADWMAVAPASPASVDRMALAVMVHPTRACRRAFERFRDGSRAIGGLDGGCPCVPRTGGPDGVGRYGASDVSLPAGHSNGAGWQQCHRWIE